MSKMTYASAGSTPDLPEEHVAFLESLDPSMTLKEAVRALGTKFALTSEEAGKILACWVIQRVNRKKRL